MTGKLLTIPWGHLAETVPKDSDGDDLPMLTVGQFKVALLGGIGSILAIVFTTYINVTVLVTQFSEYKGKDLQEKAEIKKRLDTVEGNYADVIERLIRVEQK